MPPSSDPSASRHPGPRATPGCGLADRRGLSTVEYAVILVLLAVFAIGIWRSFGQELLCTLVRVQILAGEGLANAQCPAGAVASAEDGAALRSTPQRSSSGCSRSPPGSGSGPSGAGTGATPGPSSTGTPAPSGSSAPAPAPLTVAEQTMRDIKKILCAQDATVLDDLRNRGVKIVVYDNIYFDDPVYDGKQWTTQRNYVLGTNSGLDIQLVRTQPVVDQASTLYHEAWHSHQPASMQQRDKEYEAYRKEAEWRIARGLVPASFVKKDAKGKYVVDLAAIKQHVDSSYPGITVAGPKSAPSERIVGKSASGDTVIERPDGSRYTRKPRKGDGFMSNTDHPTPPAGYAVDPKLLKCP